MIAVLGAAAGYFAYTQLALFDPSPSTATSVPLPTLPTPPAPPPPPVVEASKPVAPIVAPIEPAVVEPAAVEPVVAPEPVAEAPAKVTKQPSRAKTKSPVRTKKTAVKPSRSRAPRVVEPATVSTPAPTTPRANVARPPKSQASDNENPL